MIQIEKDLGIVCTAHRLPGHEGLCKFLHGHNYNIWVTLESQQLNEMGFVLDFSYMKEFKKEVLDPALDHGTILWEKDPLVEIFRSWSTLNVSDDTKEVLSMLTKKLWVVPWMPTVENMASYFLVRANEFFNKHGVRVTRIRLSETPSSECTAF